MFKKILIVLAGLIAAFLIIVALQPSQYRITRSATMAAPPAMVFAHVDDLHKWDAWSPWAKLDPASKVTFDGPPTGVGAVFRWAGNDQIGEGSMTIIDSKPAELVRIRLEFIKPMAGTSTSEFTFAPVGAEAASTTAGTAGTTVTWTMTGENGFVGKAFCLFMNMDQMLGGQFEQGLANLTRVVTTPAKP
jgi:uncharacterized protein YndB with AHSA1/START domain